MVYGYCRVSTKGQAKDGNSIEAQEAAVREAGAEEIYADAFTEAPILLQRVTFVLPVCYMDIMMFLHLAVR